MALAPVLRVELYLVAERVFTVGDPGRAEMAARAVSGIRYFCAPHRGTPVAVPSHGVGAPGVRLGNRPRTGRRAGGGTAARDFVLPRHIR